MEMENGMNILLTNDDGIDGEGLLALADALSRVEGISVFVMAPDSNRSAVSSLLTMTKPMKFVRRRENWFSCSGSPVDCVIAGLRSSIFDGVKFDAVVSGINKGANLGTDVVYSGTCAAARQATLYGIPGIALSVESYDGNWDFSGMARFCAENVSRLVSLCTGELFVSVNGRSSDKYSGAVFSSLSVRDYKDQFRILADPAGKNPDLFYGFFVGSEISTAARSGASRDSADFFVTKEPADDGSFRVSVTRIFAEPSAADDSSLGF